MELQRALKNKRNDPLPGKEKDDRDMERIMDMSSYDRLQTWKAALHDLVNAGYTATIVIDGLDKVEYEGKTSKVITHYQNAGFNSQ